MENYLTKANSYRPLSSRACSSRKWWSLPQAETGPFLPSTHRHRWSLQHWWKGCFWWWSPWHWGWFWLRCRAQLRKSHSQGWWHGGYLLRESTKRKLYHKSASCFLYWCPWLWMNIGKDGAPHPGHRTSSRQCRLPHTPPSSQAAWGRAWPDWSSHRHWGKLLPCTSSPQLGW